MLAVGITLGSFGLFVYHCLMQIAPDVVLPIFAVAGLVMGLNAFVYVYYSVRWVIVRIWRGFKWVFRIGRGAGSSSSEVAQTLQVGSGAHVVPTVQIESVRSGEK